MVQGVYRIDYAPSARAVCQSTTCMKPKCKIRKGAIRVGVMVEVPNRFSKSGEHSTIQSMKWRHSYCMTKQTINNMKKTFSEDVDDFDGFDELTGESRASRKLVGGCMLMVLILLSVLSILQRKTGKNSSRSSIVEKFLRRRCPNGEYMRCRSGQQAFG